MENSGEALSDEQKRSGCGRIPRAEVQCCALGTNSSRGRLSELVYQKYDAHPYVGRPGLVL